MGHERKRWGVAAVVKEMHKQVKIFVGVAKFALEGTLQDFILGCCVLLDDAQILRNIARLKQQFLAQRALMG
jgi:hypothetical protein